jgi:hypothetical protein
VFVGWVMFFLYRGDVICVLYREILSNLLLPGFCVVAGMMCFGDAAGTDTSHPLVCLYFMVY